jgi:hypothetical protein
MLKSRHLALGAVALMLMAAQKPVPERHAEIRKAILEHCTKIFLGQLSLTDADTLTLLGYTATAPRDTPGGKIPRAERGAGADKIVIAGYAKEGDPSCAVWFGGPDTRDAMDYLTKQAKKLKYKSGPAVPLGDGTLLYKMVRKGTEPRAITVILADAGGELDAGARPAVTLIMMNESN